MDNTTDPRLSNLIKIWNRTPNVSQKKAAIAMDITQPAVSYFLNGKNPLNTDIVIKFAKYLNVFPYEIDPSLNWEGFVTPVNPFHQFKYEEQ